jgi:hypothetical protein
MPNLTRKLQLAGALSVLVLLAVGVSCKGFFVNPTLTGITVTCPSCSSQSSPNLTGLGSSVQLLATGNYDDGSSKTLTGSVDWSSADATQVSVDNSSNKGRVTAEVGTTTSGVAITATEGTISGQVSVTVGQTATTVTCTSCSSGNTVSVSGSGGTVTFSASAASDWSSGNTSIMTIVGSDSTTATGTLTGTTGQVTVTATPTGSGAAGTLTITVTN